MSFFCCFELFCWILTLWGSLLCLPQPIPVNQSSFVRWAPPPKKKIVAYSSRAFIWNIYWLCFVEVTKITCYKANCQTKFVSICVQDQPRLKTKNRDHHSTCFNSTNLMAVSKFWKELLLESMLFKVSSLHRFAWKFYYIQFQDSILDNEHTSGLVLTSRVKFKTQIIVLTNG